MAFVWDRFLGQQAQFGSSIALSLFSGQRRPAHRHSDGEPVGGTLDADGGRLGWPVGRYKFPVPKVNMDRLRHTTQVWGLYSFTRVD